MDFGHWAITKAHAFQIYNSSLEEEFNHFEDWLNVFPLYRGQGGQDADGEEEVSRHLVGKFKVCLRRERSGDQGAQVGMWEEDSLTRACLSSLHSRAPSSFTLNQKQCHSLGPKSPGGSHRTGPSSSWSECMW